MTEKNKFARKPGEKGFSIIILVIGILFLIESIRMFMEEPTSSSYGALPLFLSVSIVILMLKIILVEYRNKGTNKEKVSLMDSITSVKNYVFTKDIVFQFIFVAAYCILLILGLGFEISSSLFLLVSMTYLMRGQLLKNSAYTLITMFFILIVFKTVFQVILP